MSLNIGQRIADPRSLSDELGDDRTNDNTMYSGLATYTFGSPRSESSSLDPLAEPTECISPLTSFPRRLSVDRTPRPSVSAQQPASPPFHNVSSHPSQGVALSASSLHHHSIASQSRRHSATRVPSYLHSLPPSVPRSRVVSGSDSEKSLDPTEHSDPIIPAYFSPQRGSVMPDNASQHTFGRASRTHAVTAALSHDGPIPSSSSASVTTSRSSSRASMRTTTEQFSSDDELEIDYYDGNSSPVTFARDYLIDIDEDLDFIQPGPSITRTSIFDGRRGSLPMAIPGAVQGSDVYSNRSREGSILTLRRASRSLDDSSTHRSSLSGEDPTIHPKSEPSSRAGRISLEQLQATQQQVVVEPNAYDGLNLQYILSRRSEGSIRSFNSHLSFVQASVAAAGRSSQHLSTIAPFATGSTTAFGDTFTTHLQINDRDFNTVRYFWSFQREKADASSSMRRRQQAYHRPEKSVKETPSRTQEMWRCGYVGRFKVDRLVFKPQSADPAKGAQQRIHVRHIPDPFLMGTTITGPHSIIHKHSRAIAFSIFRSYSLFSSRQAGGLSTAPTHMNMRSGTMLALKKVQEQYTSTRTTRQLGPFQTGDKKPGDTKEDKERGSRRSTRSLSSRDRERRQGQDKDKESKGKGKASSKGKGKDKKHRMNPTESAESSTATSSAGSVNVNTSSAVKQMVSSAEQPEMRIQLSPNMSSTSVSNQDTPNRRVSSASSLSPSMSDSTRSPENVSLVPPIHRHRDHRDSIDSDDRWPTRTGTTHAEAFSKLDPNAIETLRAKASSRAHTDSGSTFTERLFRVFLRGNSKGDDHSLVAAQPKAFQPPWMTTAGRDQQEENDRVLDGLNASFRDVGLLHTNHHKSSKSGPKHKPSQSVLDQIRDDCLYMLLPLWPGENDTASVQAEPSSATPTVPVPENRQFLLVYYVPFSEANPGSKKSEKKKAKHSHSSESGTELDTKAVYLPAFRVVARVVTYDELQPSGVRIPSEGLAINGPEWEAMQYSAVVPRDGGMSGTVVCQCDGRERGFDFQRDGLLKLGLCTQEELPVQEDAFESEESERETGTIVLTPIGRAAVEMIWLGCLAITSFGPSSS